LNSENFTLAFFSNICAAFTEAQRVAYFDLSSRISALGFVFDFGLCCAASVQLADVHLNRVRFGLGARESIQG
jgi:hypothetical protein